VTAEEEIAGRERITVAPESAGNAPGQIGIGGSEKSTD